MPKPEYPTNEGLWSQGKREESGYENVRFGVPYPEAVENLRKAVEGREDFDLATLFCWGTMQATAVLNILKGVEEAFGAAGQEVVRKAINKAGYQAMDGFLNDSHFPEDVDEMERISYVATGINTVLYASLEKPRLVADDRYEFDILWCPHQDCYTAFDCRVQRFFVEGMFQAVADHGMGDITASFKQIIPHGAESCHFVVERAKAREGEHPWRAYSDELSRRAMQKLAEND